MSTVASTAASLLSSTAADAVFAVPEWPWEASIGTPFFLGVFIAGICVSFILAFSIGANDVANSFGTSVGSHVLTLRQACILATIFESLGCILLGYRVSDTVRKGIIDIEEYAGETNVLAVGFLSSLIGASIWLIIATAFKLPVSGTHSIVGAVMGFTIVLKGSSGVKWMVFGKIFLSWFVSPLLSGLVSIAIFFVVQSCVTRTDNPMRYGLLLMPVFFFVTLFVNVFSIIFDGPEVFYLDDKHLPWWGALLTAVTVALVVAVLVRCFWVPKLRSRIIESTKLDNIAVTICRADTLSNAHAPSSKHFNHSGPLTEVELKDLLSRPNLINYSKPSRVSRIPSYSSMNPLLQSANDSADSSCNASIIELHRSGASYYGGVNANHLETPAITPPPTPEEEFPTPSNTVSPISDGSNPSVRDSLEVSSVFSSLQILTACFGGFAHGGNDVSNAVGPLVALWFISTSGQIGSSAQTPIWLLMFGAIGITVGLWVWGKKVIETVGKDLTTITPSSGFCIELGAATTVLFASNLGLPVSTTHCKVGSVVFVGRFRSRENVNWKIFANIVIAWFVTVPAAGIFSGVVCAILKLILID